MLIQEYLDVEGGSPFANWFNRLDPQAAAKVTTALARMEQGNLSNVKSVGGGVLECRINFGPGYRIYFGREGDSIVILLAGGKATPATGHQNGSHAVERLHQTQEEGTLKWA
jgi:putative addiction module killer protein